MIVHELAQLVAFLKDIQDPKTSKAVLEMNEREQRLQEASRENQRMADNAVAAQKSAREALAEAQDAQRAAIDANAAAHSASLNVADQRAEVVKAQEELAAGWQDHQEKVDALAALTTALDERERAFLAGLDVANDDIQKDRNELSQSQKELTAAIAAHESRVAALRQHIA
jgi:hypothetical protein